MEDAHKHRPTEPLKPGQFQMVEIMDGEDIETLVKYIAEQTHGSIHNNIVDWLATQPAILERMTKKGLLLTYFAYCVEHALDSAVLIVESKRRPPSSL